MKTEAQERAVAFMAQGTLPMSRAPGDSLDFMDRTNWQAVPDEIREGVRSLVAKLQPVLLTAMREVGDPQRAGRMAGAALDVLRANAATASLR